MIATKSLKAHAIALLSRREYSRAELRNKLTTATFEPEAVESALDDLEREGLLSDERFAQYVARRHQGRHGARKVEQDLIRYGVRPEVVDVVVTTARGQEIDAARAALSRKFRQGPTNMDEWARQGRYLQNRGYSLDTIRQLLRMSFGQVD